MKRLIVIMFFMFACAVSNANIYQLNSKSIERASVDQNNYHLLKLAEIRRFSDWPESELAEVAEKTSSAALAFALRHRETDASSPSCYIYLLQKAIDMGSTYAINQLAYEYWKGVYIDQDIPKSIEIFKKAIDLNNDFAMVNLALLYEETGFPFKESLSLMEKAVVLQNQLALFWVGQEYLLGEHLPRDLSKAEIYLKRAGGSFSLSLNKLGELYLFQYLDLDMDTLEAGLNSLDRASELGHIEATVRLATAYADKSLPIYDREQSRDYIARLVNQDSDAGAFYKSKLELSFAQNDKEYVQARKLIESYEVGGNRKVGFFLGEIYRQGLGIDQDNDQAFYWYLQAAEAGFAPSMFNAAAMILNGMVDDTKGYSAKQLLKSASDAGHENSTRLLERIEVKESELQVENALKLD